MSDTKKITDIDGSPVLIWGDTREDVEQTAAILTLIQTSSAKARNADEPAEGIATLAYELRGAATMLGVVLPVAPREACEALRLFLVASRDHESEISESILRAAYAATGDDPAELRRRRLVAANHSGRRGYLDSAQYAISEAFRALDELQAWLDRRASK